jgi:hypothetical protein
MSVTLVIFLMTLSNVKPALQIVLNVLTPAAPDALYVTPVMNNKMVNAGKLHVLLPFALELDKSF